MEKRDKIRILSLDGGGIRGIIPAKVLVHIEEKLREYTGNEDARIADYFDMIVGTSTGGILASLILAPGADGKPKYTAKDGYEFYTKDGFEIFNKSIVRKGLFRRIFTASKYSEKALEKLLREKMGDTRLSELLKPCIITTYDLLRQSSYFFNSRETDRNKGDFLLRDVLRSTSAAPTYFNPAKVENIPFEGENIVNMMNIDGGIFANNPSMCAYAEGRKTDFENWEDKHQPHKECLTARNMIMLSLGTGGGYIEFKNPEKANLWGLLDWAQKSPDIMMDGGLDTINYHMRKLFGSLDNEEDRLNFKRVDFPPKVGNSLPPYSTDMADADPGNIKKLALAAEATIQHANEKREGEYTLDEFIRKLL